MARASVEEQLASELAGRGLRATQQRVVVLRALRRARGHPTASQIHRSVLRTRPKVSLKTVYEALASLVDAGLASCVTEGGEPFRYEANPEPHYHARCRVCGRLVDLAGHSDGHIRGRTPLPDGFEVERISVTIVGRCPACRDDF